MATAKADVAFFLETMGGTVAAIYRAASAFEKAGDWRDVRP